MELRSGWDVELLGLGEGGEQALTSWMGWKKGKDYEMVNGRLQMKAASRL
jgi:alpha-methylacyl-CoA racemase